MNDYLEKFHLNGKTAYVVGGLGHIGREVSIAFSSSGAKTVVIDVESEKAATFKNELGEAGHDIHFKSFDCGDMEHQDQNFSNLLDELGCPDIFINCSYPRTGDWGKSSFREVTLTSFRKNVDIHMNSYAWLARLTAEAMVKAGNSGSIIQLGSTYGIVGQDLSLYAGTDMQENMTYAAIKGGITNLTRQMASYYGQFNIRVNMLVPGGLKGHVAGKSTIQSPVFVEQYCKKTPLRRGFG